MSPSSILAFSGLCTSARVGTPLAASWRVTSPPVCPLAPNTAIILLLLCARTTHLTSPGHRRLIECLDLCFCQENESAPALSAACLPFFAPGMGSTLSFSINQRNATCAGLLA